MDKSVDTSKTSEPALIDKVTKQRQELKQQFLKTYKNPNHHATGQGGFQFERAKENYYALTAVQRQFFKPNFFTNAIYGFFVAATILSFGYFIGNQRGDFDSKCRNGEIPYRDRHPKY